MNRPVNEDGERVTPSNLLAYRLSHDFLGPCCLCASLSFDVSAYTEASIFLATSGMSRGKYVAACATGQCRYWGKYLSHSFSQRCLTNLVSMSIVCLEDHYHILGLLVRRYPRRGKLPSFVRLVLIGCEGCRQVVVPAPEAPKSQSNIARKLQAVETSIGSVIDQVTQTPTAAVGKLNFTS